MNDLRYAIRMLLKSPAFTGVAVLTLALGLGANTAVFSIVDAVFLRPLTVPDAKHLAIIYTSAKSSRGEYAEGPTSYPDLVDYRAGAPAFSAIAGYENHGSIMRVGDDSILLFTSVVTGNYFTALGVNALHGRTFTEQEFQGAEIPQEVVISHSVWQKYFAGDTKVVGTEIQLTGKNYVIAGILPKEFRGTELMLAPDIYMPLPVWGQGLMVDRSSASLHLIGRLRRGATLEQARAQMSTVAERLATAYPKERGGRYITVTWEPDTRKTPAAVLFLGIASLVLLIACANVASILLARGETRRREIATRMAIGATRLRVVRQMLTESLVLSLLSMGAALAVALWVITIIPGLLPAGLPLGLDFRLDQRAVLFSFAAALGSLIIFGIAPAVHSCRVSLVSDLKEGGATGAAPVRVLTRDVLIVFQVALSMALMIGAGLLVRSFLKASQQDLGFDSRGQGLILQVLPGRGQTNFQSTYRQLLQRIEAVPGVERASLGNRAPLANYGGGRKTTVFLTGMQLQPNEQGIAINSGNVDGGYFQALGMHLQRGRTFGPQDQPNSQRVTILNEAAARRLFPENDAVGRHLRFGGPSGTDYEVIGVLQDAKYNVVTEEPMPYLYVSVSQAGVGDIALFVRTRVKAESVLPQIRKAIKDFDPAMSVFATLTLADHIRTALYEQRVSAQLVLVLGLLGLTLAVVGLYGVLSYYVNRRRHEIGVRIAIGAQPRAVFAMIVRRGFLLASIGVVVGEVASLAVTRYLKEFLYRVSPQDPLTLVAVACVLLGMALLAAAVPARRAARVDPMVALRYE